MSLVVLIFKICLFINALEEDKDTDYVIGCISRAICTSKPTALYTALFHSIKFSGYRIKIQFNNSVLVVQKYNCAAKNVYAYIVCDKDDCPKIPLYNVKLKNYLFSVVYIRKNSHKSNYVYTVCGITFDDERFVEFW